MTSAEAQARYAVTQPVFGHLFEDMVYPDGATVPVSRFIRPQIEVEVGLILGRPLVGPGVTPDQVRQAVEMVAPCFELIDSRIRAWGGGIADSVADNAFSAGVVVCERRTPYGEVALERVCVTAFADDREIGRVSPWTGPSDPIAVVAWLANTLSSHGLVLEAGELVLSGSLLPPLEIRPGLRFCADMEALGDLAVMFVEGEIR
jgi:2-keto-4-pentenoate hydratase